MTDTEHIVKFMGLDKMKNEFGYINDSSSRHFILGLSFWDYGRLSIEHLRFDTDWNWLMAIVDEIENTHIPGKYNFIVSMSTGIIKGHYNCTIDGKSWGKGYYSHEDGVNRFEVVYRSCVKFIKWYHGERK